MRRVDVDDYDNDNDVITETLNTMESLHRNAPSTKVIAFKVHWRARKQHSRSRKAASGEAAKCPNLGGQHCTMDSTTTFHPAGPGLNLGSGEFFPMLPR